ncbi:Indoleamine 2,3-dioxygenase, partial [Chytriomyces sp. MP71]
MRNYMPGSHRRFIEAVTDSYSIKDYIESLPRRSSGASELTSLFNRCVEGMKSFRNTHIQMVSVYIVSQANKRKDVGNAGIPAQVQTERLQNGLLARGTGGTNLIPFLKQSRD